MGADLVGLVVFNGAGVGHLGIAQAKLRQRIENLPALDL
jgi:hypothetical protein